MAVNTTVLMIVFAFAFVPLVLAEVARRKALPTIEDFFLQSRGMKTVTVFCTIYATWMSAYAFLGASGYFYEKGPVYMTSIGWDLLFALLIYVVGRRIWFYGRKNGYVTPTDFFNDIYESTVLNILVIGVSAIFTIFYLQIQLVGGAYLIEIATGGAVSWQISGLIFYLIIIIYLWAGGLRAVAYADVFYAALMIAGILVTGAFLMEVAGGFERVFQTIIEMNRAYVTLPGPEGDAGPLLWLSMFLLVPIGAVMGPQMWIRCYAAGSAKTFNLLPFLICITSVQCFGTLFAGSAGVVLNPAVEKADTIVPVLLLQYGPPLLCAFIFCAIASAILSTANSQILALSAIYTVDIHRRFLQKDISEKRAVTIGKYAVIVASAIAYVRILSDPKLIMDTGALAFGGTAQLLPPVLGALFWKRSGGKAAAAGIVTGVAVLLVGAIFLKVNTNYCAVAALLCNGAVFTAGSLLLSANSHTREKIVAYRRACEEEKL